MSGFTDLGKALAHNPRSCLPSPLALALVPGPLEPLVAGSGGAMPNQVHPGAPGDLGASSGVVGFMAFRQWRVPPPDDRVWVPALY